MAWQIAVKMMCSPPGRQDNRCGPVFKLLIGGQSHPDGQASHGLGLLAGRMLSDTQPPEQVHSQSAKVPCCMPLLQVSSVDKTAPTLMCVLGLGEALGKEYGPDMIGEKILPLLTPLLVAPTFSREQFGTAMR